MKTVRTMSFLAAAALLALPACAPGLFQSLFSANALQVSPGSTTVGPNQNLTFQVSGGTPPYQYQVNGTGSIDSSGNYQSGTSTGQAQIQVTDTANNTGTAMVSVVDPASIPSSYSNYKMANRAAPAMQGWTPTTPTQLKQAPPVRGQVLAVEDQSLDTQGDAIRSKFLKTDLKHPLVRLDTLIQNQRIVATRAVIEDQFFVTLQEGRTEADLTATIAQSGAYISKQVTPGLTYLISMNPATHASPVSESFLASRASLKQALQGLGKVSPNFVTSRAPASVVNP